ALGRGILADVEQLLGQHADLLRQEIKDELAKAAGAGLAVTTGAGATAVGGLLGVLAAGHLLHKAAGLALGLCYALTGGGPAGGAGRGGGRGGRGGRRGAGGGGGGGWGRGGGGGGRGRRGGGGGGGGFSPRFFGVKKKKAGGKTPAAR